MVLLARPFPSSGAPADVRPSAQTAAACLLGSRVQPGDVHGVPAGPSRLGERPGSPGVLTHSSTGLGRGPGVIIEAEIGRLELVKLNRW